MTVNHFKQTLKYGEHHSIILMQLLIISSLKRLSRYVSYREASIAIRIVSWGECIVAALMYRYIASAQSDQSFHCPHEESLGPYLLI